MVEQLRKRFEGVATAAGFVAELSTQRFLKKWPVDSLLDKKPKFVAGRLGRLRLIALYPRAEGYTINRSGFSLIHTCFPFDRPHHGLHQQQREEGTGQSVRNDVIFKYSNPTTQLTQNNAIYCVCEKYMAPHFVYRGDRSRFRAKQHVHGGEECTSLDESIQRRLSRWLGLRLPQLRIHTGPLFDELLDRHSAHAMTLGGDIYVRSDKYHPESAQGLALVGHEMTHVAQQYTALSLPDVYDTARQERVALESEQLVHRLMHADSSPGNRVAAAHQKPDIESIPSVRHLGASGSVTPMFADAVRSVPPTELSVSTSVLSEAEMSRVKQEVYRDIMQKIRIEIERGA